MDEESSGQTQHTDGAARRHASNGVRPAGYPLRYWFVMLCRQLTVCNVHGQCSLRCVTLSVRRYLS